jgi:hypothetical protein
MVERIEAPVVQVEERELLQLELILDWVNQLIDDFNETENWAVQNWLGPKIDTLLEIREELVNRL